MGYVKHPKVGTKKAVANHSRRMIVCGGLVLCVALFGSVVLLSKDDQVHNVDLEEKVNNKSKTEEVSTPVRAFKRMLGVELGSKYEYSQTEYDVYKLNSSYHAWEIESDLRCKAAFYWLKPPFFGADIKLVLHGEKLNKKFGVLVVIPCTSGTERDKANEIVSLFQSKYACSQSRKASLMQHPEKYSPVAANKHEKFEYSLIGDEFYAEVVAVTAIMDFDSPVAQPIRNNGFVVVLVVHPGFDSYIDIDKQLVNEAEETEKRKASKENYNQL